MIARSRILYAVLDVLCLGIVWAADILTSKWSTFKRGFFCGDESIRYPYRESTLSSKEFGAIFVCVPILLIIVIEVIRCRTSTRSSRTSNRYTQVDPVSLGPIRIPATVLEVLRILGVFLFGLGCAKLLTDVAKHSVGRLRPNFIDVCQPDVINNTSVACQLGFYYQDFHCLGSSDKLIRDARLSFPSGHATFSSFTMIFTVVYLQAKMTWKSSLLLRPLLQAAAILATFYAGLLRVNDNKHHWSDVLAGFVIGTLAAVLTALYVLRLFRPARDLRTTAAAKENEKLATDAEAEAMETLP